jgi:hypothetical protein
MSRRHALLATEALLVVAYVAVFLYLALNSADFIVTRNNGRAMEAAIARAAEVPARFDFVAPSADVELLGAGWYRDITGAVGARGPWSKSAAYVFIPVPAGASATITLVGHPFLAPGHETVNIGAWLDGTEAGRWTARLSEPGPSLTMSVPASATGDGLLELRLDVDDEAAPAHFTASTDKRHLGFHLLEITVEP